MPKYLLGVTFEPGEDRTPMEELVTQAARLRRDSRPGASSMTDRTMSQAAPEA